MKQKGFLSAFYPDAWIDCTYSIDFGSWYERGFRGVIFAIDNTLVPHGAPVDKRALTLFEYLHQIGFSTCLLSNNQLSRVKPFANIVKSVFVENAYKPLIKNYLKACEMMKLEKERVLFVGDQLFTDIWGSKRAGIYNILVKPLHPKEKIQILLKRKLEWVVLYFFRKHCPDAKLITVLDGYESYEDDEKNLENYHEIL